jgi:hypothetical protein
MNYLIAGYIFIGACYSTASWVALKENPKNKALVASLKKEGPVIRAVAAFVFMCVAAIWPFLLLTLLFGLLIRHTAITGDPTDGN